jgi:hypothetical protein
MGWLQRLFGMEQPPQEASVSPPEASSGESIPLERLGLNGEYDDSGLAKRVALAFDQEAELTNIPGVDVLQTSSTVVLRGLVPTQAIADRLSAVAGAVSGATQVDTSELTIGIPPERVGLNGEYDESGLAKRVVQALEQEASLSSVAPFDISQAGGTVVIQGSVPSQDLLDKMVMIAQGVSGAVEVRAHEVTVG